MRFCKNLGIAMSEKDLEHLRIKIDNIDEQILDLLNQRLEVVREIGITKHKNKSSIYRPEREKQIIYRLSKMPSKYLDIKAIEAIYQEIFAISRNLEMPEKVAYLGPLGSYTHQAAEESFGAMSEYLSINTISAVFKTLESKQAKYGVVPIENNTNGIVGECIDNLANSDLKIISEIILPIHHSFASHCEHLGQVKRIYSKDIAFGQCSNFLSAYNLLGIEQIPVESTAKAAQLANKDKSSATICSKIAAKIYGLPVMFDNIQDFDDNKTRFVVVSDFSVAPSGRDKTSVFATPSGFDKPGALLELLQDFKEAKINLLKLDSRPIRANSDFSFGFYIDFDGHIQDKHIAKLFEKRANHLKWLGSYPASIKS